MFLLCVQHVKDFVAKNYVDCDYIRFNLYLDSIEFDFEQEQYVTLLQSVSQDCSYSVYIHD